MKTVIVWILVAALTGCTTLRPVEDASNPAALQSKVRVNDRVQLTTRDGQSYYFLVTDIGSETLAGNTKRGRHVELPYDQIASLEVRRVSAGKTVPLVIVVTVTLTVVIGLAIGHGIARALTIPTK